MEEDGRERGRQCALELTVCSHTRARVVATGVKGPQLQHVPKGCFLKGAVDLRYPEAFS